jgi:hypothetical protein
MTLAELLGAAYQRKPNFKARQGRDVTPSLHHCRAFLLPAAPGASPHRPSSTATQLAGSAAGFLIKIPILSFIKIIYIFIRSYSASVVIGRQKRITEPFLQNGGQYSCPIVQISGGER